MDIFTRVQELAFPSGQYVVVGSASMEVYGLRKAHDLDVLVTETLFATLKNEGWEEDGVFAKKGEKVRERLIQLKRKRLIRPDAEVLMDFYEHDTDRLISSAGFIERAEIINGLPFMPLQELLDIKRIVGRGKDLADVELIESYLKVRN
ncbi:hypothetical protein A3D62_01050 [Candidatus Kaiserbacteria bacterium RIFCSPHIGHO2_02_FULL_49_11]|uniref:Uncharacterized protein n=1 Tax=Candidatus Kaiserbacteria bacterium RIFCSPHIGHO2_02_FULL_49_11 TaxID=1798489 RepID=A0A1F6D222_9BACT|nr:MAG: hypothetical protein A3D62_01050 [Candidatus Kaiserbacteria bacterium RIFCSPHIGHO2_02_FULL_49_11]